LPESGIKRQLRTWVNLVTLNFRGKADKEIANMEDMISKKVDMVLTMTLTLPLDRRPCSLPTRQTSR
jgi:hypothetical protein